MFENGGHPGHLGRDPKQVVSTAWFLKLRNLRGPIAHLISPTKNYGTHQFVGHCQLQPNRAEKGQALLVNPRVPHRLASSPPPPPIVVRQFDGCGQQAIVKTVKQPLRLTGLKPQDAALDHGRGGALDRESTQKRNQFDHF